MLRSLVYRSSIEKVSESRIETTLGIFSDANPGATFEKLALLCLAHSNAADAVRKLPYYTKWKELSHVVHFHLGQVIREVTKKEGGLCTLDILGLNPVHTVSFFTKVVEETGSALAMALLAKCLEEGGHGIEQNIPRAAPLYSRAIEEKRDPVAMRLLADLLLTGRGEGTSSIQKDTPRATELF